MLEEEETLPDDILVPGDETTPAEADTAPQAAEDTSGDAFGLLDEERGEIDTEARLEALEALVETLQGQIGGQQEEEEPDIPPDDGRFDELTGTIARQQAQINGLNEILDEMGEIPPEAPRPTQRDIVTPGVGLAASMSNGQLSIQPDGIRRHDVRDYIDWGGDDADDETEVLFGKPTSAFSSGATIELDPCDAHGTDNDVANVTVYTQADQSSYSMTNSTSIGTDQIVPYVVGDDSEYYMLGTPVEIVTDWQFNASTHYLQKKTRNVWIDAPGSESGWINIHQLVETQPLSDFNIDTTSFLFQIKRQGAWVFVEETEDAGWTTEHTGTDECP